MESSSWLEVVLKRLRFLKKPLPLAATLGVLLLGIFVWDFLRHPEWFGAFEEEATGPNEDIDLSGLTPEEQAAVAGIDNLTLLFNELGIESGGIPQVQALAEDTDQEQNAFLNETLALSQPGSANSALGDSPFTRYLQQYQFRNNAAASGPSNSGSRAAFGGINFNYFGRANSGDATTEEQRINPLMTALRNQGGLSRAVQPNENSPLANELRSQFTSDLAASETDAETEEATQDGLPPGQFSSQTVTIPGIDFPVLPTLPQMSPPPGTTGYTPPASLDLMPPLPGRSGSSSSVFPATASPLPGNPGVSSGAAVPSINTDVDVSNGYVTPYPAIAPNTATTPSAAAQPFTAPRPPGSYIGGGYVNTFSNPNGPSN